MMNIFKHKKILCAMLAVIMLVPCFTLTASAETTFRKVATYTSIWENASYRSETGVDGYAYYSYSGYISYGKNPSNGINNPYTDCFVRAESFRGSLPTQDLRWRATTNMQYYGYSTQTLSREGSEEISGGEIYISKNDPDYGPLVTYYRGPNGNYDLDLWYRIHADIVRTGGDFNIELVGVGTASDGKVYLHGVND